MGVLLALLAAVSFGLSDVTGAVAARRASALTVTLGMQVVGLVALVPTVPLAGGTPSVPGFALGAVAGGLGATGLVVYLRAMAVGPIGVVSPISALVGAGVPVAWGVILLGEIVGPLQVAGIVLGLTAVATVAYVPGTSWAGGLRSTAPALLSGAAFGLFFVALAATPDGSGMWPLLGARVAAVAIVAAAVAARRRAWIPHGAVGLVAISGLADVGANALFLAASRVGLLSLVSLLASLYPVVALLIARWWLAERLTGLQAAGVVAALIATGLLAATG